VDPGYLSNKIPNQGPINISGENPAKDNIPTAVPVKPKGMCASFITDKIESPNTVNSSGCKHQFKEYQS